MKRSLLSIVVVLLCAVVRPVQAESPSGVGLVVLIVVDQMRGDYLPRFEKHFGDGGFRRLMRNGADFRNAYFSYGSTSTAPGHATLGSGRIPRQHGIVANEWWLDADRTESQHAVNDPDSHLVGLAPGKDAVGASPWRLVGPSLGDEMKLADARSRVFSIALKDRAAILMAGRNPDAVYWWDTGSGRFVTSTWYAARLPEHIAAFNQEGVVSRLAGASWTLLLPEASYAGCQPLDPGWVLDDYGIGRSFPHALPKTEGAPDKAFCKAVVPTPFGNELVLDIVQRVLEHDKPGTRDAVDLLCVSFSSNDYCGHLFGPDSREMLDITVRTDRQIERLLSLLDRRVGLQQCLVVLTADHGVKSIPALARLRKLGGTRLPDQVTLTKHLNEAMLQVAPSPQGRPYVLGAEMPWVYFQPWFRTLERDTRTRLLDAAVSELKKMDGVADVYTADELAGPPPAPEDSVRYLAWRSFYPGRSGELYVQQQPYVYDELDKATGHGTTSSQDRHVPIVLMGPGIRCGRYFTPADPADIAVTLAALIGVEKPLDAVGRVLHEAIDASTPTALAGLRR